MAQKRETVFRKRVREDLATLYPDVAFFPIQQKAIRGDADYMLCILGDFGWLELKDRKGAEAKLQEFKRASVAKAKGHTFVANQDTWGNVFQTIKDIIKEKKLCPSN